jgi:hypothetical protein
MTLIEGPQAGDPWSAHDEREGCSEKHSGLPRHEFSVPSVRGVRPCTQFETFNRSAEVGASRRSRNRFILQRMQHHSTAVALLSDTFRAMFCTAASAHSGKVALSVQPPESPLEPEPSWLASVLKLLVFRRGLFVRFSANSTCFLSGCSSS